MTLHPLAPIRRLFSVQNGGTPKTSVPEYWGGDLAWVTPEDLGKSQGRFIHSSRRTVTNRGLQASSAEIVPAGSIVMSTRAPIGYTAIAGLPLATNQGCKTLVPTREIDPRFFEYELSVRTGDLNVLGTGATFSELSTDALASFRVPVPPLASQRRIAEFLDRETERIDALIDKKRRLIDLLEEKRTATITQAVTKGLDPTVPMRDSGIPWIGEIPEHWRVVSFRHVCRLQRGFDLPESDREHGVVPLVSSGGITDHISRAAVPGPGVVTGRYGSVGAVHWVEDGYWPLNTTLYSSSFSMGAPRYVFYLLAAMPLLAETGKSAVPGISREDIDPIRVPIPAEEEQTRIVRFLNEHTDNVDRATSTITAQLDLLAEYREALITAAVTGEIDVDTFNTNRNLERATP